MNSDQNLKFLFVGIMIVLALIGRVDRDHYPIATFQDNIQDTSLVTSPPPQAALIYLKPQPPQNLESLTSEIIPLVPYRKDWNQAEPGLKVKAAVAKDLDLDSDFYRFNAEARWPLASLTKLMTAVVALEEVGLDKIAAVSQAAVDSEGPAGNLAVDEQYLINDLVKAMLVVSSNDAAAAIAEFYGRENFIEAMQKKALDLGMLQTNFVDPTGLSFLNQGNISDLEKLVKYVYKNHPEIWEITRRKSVKVLELTKNKEKELLNINNFAFNGHPDFAGGKTGFTDQAGGNLISIFDYQGHKVLIVVLGTEDRFGQTEVLHNWIKNAYTF